MFILIWFQLWTVNEIKIRALLLSALTNPHRYSPKHRIHSFFCSVISFPSSIFETFQQK